LFILNFDRHYFLSSFFFPSLRDLLNKFGIRNKVNQLFDRLEPIEPSEWLKTTLKKAVKLPTRSEKAKSESIVYPILLELRDRNNRVDVN